MSSSTPNPMIQVDSISKHFGRVAAVDNVSLEIQEGEFFALLGPSGCGKTTLLRMLAGLEAPTDGKLFIDGEDMIGVAPNKRPVNMVFQSYAVFPHMTVEQNVAYGLRVSKSNTLDINIGVREALALVQLEGFEKRKPDQLSGGQRQRVALARALIKRPKVLLLDEPMSALDAKLRESMQLELVKLQQSLGITFVIVTHDQTEALSMADRIAVMDAGLIQQLADPKTLYEKPNNRFVADFIGKMNLFSGQVEKCDGQTMIVNLKDLGRVTLPGRLPAKPVHVAVRPEKIRLFSTGGETQKGVTSFPATVVSYAYHGSETQLFLETSNGQPITASLRNDRRHQEMDLQKGQTLRAGWHNDDALVLES